MFLCIEHYNVHVVDFGFCFVINIIIAFLQADIRDPTNEKMEKGKKNSDCLTNGWIFRNEKFSEPIIQKFQLFNFSHPQQSVINYWKFPSDD